MFACIYRPPSSSATLPLTVIAEQFSPRYERHRDNLVSLDLTGLSRLFGDAQTIADELRRAARTYQVQVHVAIAGTRTAALVLAHMRPGVTIVAEGQDGAALAPIPIRALDLIADGRAAPPGPAGPTARTHADPSGPAGTHAGRADPRPSGPAAIIDALKTWGIRTLGEFAALPSADLSARLGQDALEWQAIARGEDARPLVPTVPDERFESSIELGWPIDGLEPLSFVLTRLLEPLIVRLERRDRGAAAIATTLRLVSRETSTRRLELPTPLRDVRTLRTLILLDLDAHPAGEAIDAVTITIEPTPGRVLQHTLFTRPTPTPEQLSTLLARLHALMGQERVGAPAVVDTYRPGAFAIEPFATDHDRQRDRREPDDDRRRDRQQESTSGFKTSPGGGERAASGAQSRHPSPGFSARAPVGCSPTGPDGGFETSANRNDSGRAADLPQALRRCRQPVPARVAVEDGRPARVTTDRRGYAGGRVVRASGPWSVSGEWWEPSVYRRDEWDVELADGAVYRIFHDDFSERWFVDAIFD